MRHRLSTPKRPPNPADIRHCLRETAAEYRQWVQELHNGEWIATRRRWWKPSHWWPWLTYRVRFIPYDVWTANWAGYVPWG